MINYNELIDAICELVNLAWDSTSKEEFERLDNAGADIIDCLEEIQQYRAIGSIEEFKRAKEMEVVYGQVKWERDIAISQLEEIGVALGQKMEEFKALKEKNEEVEIPEPQGNEIVAGIILPKVKGKAVVSLSDLHDILMDVGVINIRDKVFEQIYDRGVIIGLRDVIEKWEERRKNAEHEDCALSCEEIRNKAIDEFAETLKEKYEEHNFGLCLRQNDYYSYSNSCMLFESYIDEIAEQLKAGA